MKLNKIIFLSVSLCLSINSYVWSMEQNPEQAANQSDGELSSGGNKRKLEEDTTQHDAPDAKIQKTEEDSTEIDMTGWNDLHKAAYAGNLKAIKALVARGIDPNATVDNPVDKFHGHTALHIAAFYGQLDIIRLLVNEFKVNVDIRSKNPGPTPRHGRTPLHIAVIYGKLNVIRLLVSELHANVNAGMDNPGTEFHRRTALYIAADMGKIDVIRLLINELHVDVNTPINNPGTPYHGVTALHVAATSGKLDAISLLVNELHVDVNTTINNPGSKYHGFAALHLAAAYGKPDVIRLLVNELHVGVNTTINNPESKYHGFAALHIAAINGKFEVIRLLVNDLHVNANIPINSPGNKYHGFAALHLAVIYFQKEIVCLLVAELYADVNRQINAPGNELCHKATALHLAVYKGHAAIVDLLLQNRADARIEDVNRKTAFDIAFDKYNTDLGLKILSFGTSIIEGGPIPEKNSDGKYELARFRCGHAVPADPMYIVGLGDKCPCCGEIRQLDREQCLAFTQDHFDRANSNHAAIDGKAKLGAAFEKNSLTIQPTTNLGTVYYDGKCCICRDDLSIGQKVIIFNCGHIICANPGCFIGLKEICPICRAPRILEQEKILIITQEFLKHAKK